MFAWDGSVTTLWARACGWMVNFRNHTLVVAKHSTIDIQLMMVLMSMTPEHRALLLQISHALQDFDIQKKE